jgi:hypothetical protein
MACSPRTCLSAVGGVCKGRLLEVLRRRSGSEDPGLRCAACARWSMRPSGSYRRSRPLRIRCRVCVARWCGSRPAGCVAVTGTGGWAMTPTSGGFRMCRATSWRAWSRRSATGSRGGRPAIGSRFRSCAPAERAGSASPDSTRSATARHNRFTHWGSFAEFTAVDWADVNLVALPDGLESDAAAALGCRFATAYRAVVQVGRVRGGEWVAVHSDTRGLSRRAAPGRRNQQHPAVSRRAGRS